MNSEKGFNVPKDEKQFREWLLRALEDLLDEPGMTAWNSAHAMRRTIKDNDFRARFLSEKRLKKKQFSLTAPTKVSAGAHFSECRKYRYSLWRIWDPEKPCVAFIGLNLRRQMRTPTIQRSGGVLVTPRSGDTVVFI